MREVMKKKITTKKKHKREDWRLTALAMPFVLYIIAFKYVPLFGWALAFTNYRPGRSLEKLQFVGLKYFKLIGYYWDDIQNALVNTLVLSIMSLAAMILPLIFAICLNEVSNSKLKKLIQTAVTLPHFISWVIVFAITFALFSTNGMLNTLLIGLGWIEDPLQIMASEKGAWLFMVILDIWKTLGWNSIVYLAAIAGIDASLYEAAKIDGAGRFACAFHITLPSLMPTFVVLLIMNVGKLLSVGLDKYLLFSNSVTSSKLEVLDMFTYRIGILTQDYSFAIAVSILKSIVSIILITVANVVAKKVRGETVI